MIFLIYIKNYGDMKMANQFKSVTSFIKGVSNLEFFLLYIIDRFKYCTGHYLDDVIKEYQDKRFYLDEYPEQEQLRFEWLFQNSEPFTSSETDLIIENCEWVEFPQKELEQNNLGNFLSNRFLKRN